jgi:hypothetical protein
MISILPTFQTKHFLINTLLPKTIIEYVINNVCEQLSQPELALNTVDHLIINETLNKEQ